MIYADPPPPMTPLRAAIDAHYLIDEARAVATVLAGAHSDTQTTERIAIRARALVESVRRRRAEQGGLDALLREYDLSTQEGVVLMCLAEALLRIPDPATADRLIRDKLADADWQRHLGASDSLLVNAASFGLMLTGRIVRLDDPADRELSSVLGRLVARSGEPLIRAALKEAMGILGRQFVLGTDIHAALQRAAEPTARMDRYSFDMLGEAALTVADAERYTENYLQAIAVLAARAGDAGELMAAPSISVKLSALHPRFEFAQRARVLKELVPRLTGLTAAARDAGIVLTLDAEEADRLDITLDVFERVFADSAFASWDGLGIVVQAYQKRALPVIDWLAALAGAARRRIPLRLVKGAYWDTEIKRAQERGLDGFPVYTRKLATDVAYLACARRVLVQGTRFYPQFASHNAYTVAAVGVMAGDRRDYEFQRLHGMGEELYRALREDLGSAVPCRVYAPVGSHTELLPYLVRRLLENGANTSFVQRLDDEQAPIDDLIADPVARLEALPAKAHPRIPLPIDLYGPARRNARGINLNDASCLAELATSLANVGPFRATAGMGGGAATGAARRLIAPAQHSQIVGEVIEADARVAQSALAAAAAAAPDWARREPGERAAVLRRAADGFEARRAECIARVVREGGRCIPDAVAEWRETVDYCRYYAERLERDFAPVELPGPSGERNRLALHGRGVFLALSPWNFPLAIFSGQVLAALAAGNGVLAKPARQTPGTAALAVEILIEAGVPAGLLQYLPGSGADIGAALLGDARLSGVVFTGSTETACAIHRRLAQRDGALAPLIAETGGQNCMIADSSALPEQLVTDVLASAFNSAGQRCSALRVLFVQEDIAPRVIDLLCGAMAELRIGDPALLATDVGPVIDAGARQSLNAHIARLDSAARRLYQTPLPPESSAGTYVAPTAFAIDRLSLLDREVFGPVLHVITWQADRLDAVIDAINATGYGLTLGIHSRIEATARYIAARVRAGNIYVNRNMIGAVVGVQPFGGEGLSGTGPKAGGPHYLPRFAVERTLTENIAALGGNPALLMLSDDAGQASGNDAQ